VPTRTQTPGQPELVIYDFVANTCSAQWTSGAGTLPCPGQQTDVRGFVLSLDQPVLEGGTAFQRPSLLVAPQSTSSGFISGSYPAFTVQAGEHFLTIIGCEDGATGCLVLFRLDYQVGSAAPATYWGASKQYDGKPFPIDVDLSLLSGQDVRFTLSVVSLGPASGNQVVLVAPRVIYIPH
jgi:hypothetical protein